MLTYAAVPVSNINFIEVITADSLLYLIKDNHLITIK